LKLECIISDDVVTLVFGYIPNSWTASCSMCGQWFRQTQKQVQ